MRCSAMAESCRLEQSSPMPLDRLIAGFKGFDFVGEPTRIEKMIESQQERIQKSQNQLNLINREFLPGDIESLTLAYFILQMSLSELLE
ncbi:hypothetical protein GN244_ATG17998 [Phytophthora infestans]|uniref:Uncharacterized protein n=1 Tax=Phytophthora infestans TaxID=4787 RepID=A0A833VV90_PHYIN|nr:hypothetical protein GN244_ATG17998 [Phytophthora infestans]